MTREVKTILQSLTPAQLFDPSIWPKLAFFALIEPDGDILPVRTIYGDGHVGEQTNIGLNPLTSQRHLWFAGPDIVASLLLSRKMPRILRAIRYESEGRARLELRRIWAQWESFDPSRSSNWMTRRSASACRPITVAGLRFAFDTHPCRSSIRISPASIQPLIHCWDYGAC